ncbi:MAG TPA: hypothetical protein VKA37_09905, partial [Halobacteriales archaeon]|nr:hypothetical protein [Halobacteriales archaeon]
MFDTRQPIFRVRPAKGTPIRSMFNGNGIGIEEEATDGWDQEPTPGVGCVEALSVDHRQEPIDIKPR